MSNPSINTRHRFIVTRRFTGGLLEGLEHIGTTNIAWKVGETISKPLGGSPYVIVNVEPNPDYSGNRLED
jgi:hypothetical protein